MLFESCSAQSLPQAFMAKLKMQVVLGSSSLDDPAAFITVSLIESAFNSTNFQCLNML